MAMVHQLTEGEVTNRNTVEDGSHASEHSGDSSSRPSSRSSGRSRRSTPGLLPQYQYSREELVKISKLPSSQKRPNCLDVAHNNTTGKWDPERWFVNKRGDKQLPPEEPRSKRERQEVDVGISHKRRPSDPKERIKEEKDEIVLSPQRRSFGTGCHVIQQSSLARRPGSPSDNRESENYREPSRRIGSGRIISRDRDQREWDRDHRDYGYSGGRNERRDRFDQDDGEKEVRRYSNRYGRGDRRISKGRSGDRIDEEEPEWFSGGPTSQSETIELVGFDDAPNDDDRKSKKVSGRKSKENSRRQSLVSEDGDKIESAPFQDGHPPRKGNQLSTDAKTSDNSKPSSPELQSTREPEDSKSVNTNFDLDELFRMEWIPGLLPNGALPDRPSNEISCSRFSQWFKRDSPILGLQGSGENSRRSSLQDELIAHVFSGIGEPHLLIPSPTPTSSESYFTPISPALPHSSPNYTMPPSHAPGPTTSKNILEMLQTANISNNESMINGDSSKNTLAEKDVTEKAKSVEQLEADLKRIVLGDKGQLQEERSAFDKLLRHMTEASSSPPSSISMGPLDKSKALQEEDLLQNILGRVSSPQPTQSLHSQALLDDKSLPTPVQHPGLVRPQYLQQPQPPQNDMFAQLLQHQHQQRLQQQQQLQQSQQQQLQQSQQQQLQQSQQQQQGMNIPGLTVDMLAKLLGTQPHPQPPVSPISSGLHQSSTASFNNRNEQSIAALLQQQRQRELISSILKQQQPPPPPPPPQPPQPPQVIAQPPIIQHRCPSSKEIVPGSVPQTLGIPPMTGGLSPRQSPLPSDAISSAIPNQGRIPSPLVFGQQPPALSHAPAPIHPAHLAQAMAQNVTANSNTLQVQNALVLQRVPSPQELAVHTQSILQNALIKRKLEEQKENFRKRQEAQRTSSPSVTNNNNKNGVSTSPLKGLSPTMAAFTPTSVMRKMHSEKLDKDIQSKTDIVQNGCSKIIGCSAENRSSESGPNGIKTSNMATSTSNTDGTNVSANNNDQPPHASVGSAVGPRPVHGQGVMNQPRSQQNSLSATPSIIIPGQGRPIVKGGSGQIGAPSGGGGDIPRTAIGTSKGNINHNKHFLLSNPQAHPLHPEISPGMDTVAKFMEQQRILQQQQAAALAAQRQQNTSPMPPLHTATFALGPRGPQHPLIRPMNIGPTASASTLNFPFLRAFQASPAMRAAQACSLNPLSQLGQLAALQQQLQRGTADSRQIQALAQARGLHPLALQQLLLNAQTQAAAAQVQVAAGLAGARGDGKHQHLIPGQGPTNRQSPVNLAKWFGNDVLKQKMPEMPPVSHQKALLVEEVERQQQQSTTVHN